MGQEIRYRNEGGGEGGFIETGTDEPRLEGGEPVRF